MRVSLWFRGWVPGLMAVIVVLAGSGRAAEPVVAYTITNGSEITISLTGVPGDAARGRALYGGEARAGWSEIKRLWKEGQNVVFDVDVKGGMSLKKYFGDNALAIFVKAPSEEVLRDRLTHRNSETEEAISRRLFKVKFESGFADQFDVVLLNDDLEESFAKAQKLYSEFMK